MIRENATIAIADRGRLGLSFWLLWAACSATFLSDGLIAGSLPLMAASESQDARLVSLVSSIFSLGALVTGMIAGAVADRRRRLGLMWQANIVRLGLLTLLAVLLAVGHGGLAVLVGVSALLGAVEPYFDSASSAVIPEVVPPSQYERANVLIQVALLGAGSLLGPPLGGVLFSLDAVLPGLMTAVTFAISAAILIGLERIAPPQPVASDHVDSTIVRDLVAGVAYLWHERELRTLTGCAAAVNGVVAGVLAILVLFVTRDLGLPDRSYGMVVACFAVGGGLVSVFMSSIVRRYSPRALVSFSLVTLALCSIAIGVFVHVVVTCLALACAGAAVIVWNVVVVTYRQRTVPLEMLGRVTSAYRVTGKAAMVVGAAAAGQIALRLGVPAAFVAGGVLLLVVIVVTASGLRGLTRTTSDLRSQ